MVHLRCDVSFVQLLNNLGRFPDTFNIICWLQGAKADAPFRPEENLGFPQGTDDFLVETIKATFIATAKEEINVSNHVFL